MEDNNILNLFDKLSVLIENSLKDYHKLGSEYYSKSNFQEAQKIITKIEGLNIIKKDLDEIKTKLINLLPEIKIKKPNDDIEKSGSYGERKLSRGLKTPQAKFRLPILRALMSLGGSASINEVIDIIKEDMKDELNKYDYEPLKSTPHFPRWRNTAQWERDTMVKIGLLKKDSPRTIWEISDDGKTYLKNFGIQTETASEQSFELSSKNEDILKLFYILSVYKYIKSGILSFENACKKVSLKSNNLNMEDLIKFCTSSIGLSINEFIEMKDNDKVFSKHLIKYFPNQEDYIHTTIKL